MSPKSQAFVTLLVVLTILGVVMSIVHSRAAACERVGGVLVRGYSGDYCVKEIDR